MLPGLPASTGGSCHAGHIQQGSPGRNQFQLRDLGRDACRVHGIDRSGQQRAAQFAAQEVARAAGLAQPHHGMGLDCYTCEQAQTTGLMYSFQTILPCFASPESTAHGHRFPHCDDAP